jgi:hypothetical protein
MHQLVNQLDIILPNGEPYVAPSAVTQACKKQGHQAIESIFNQTQSLWHEKSEHPMWCRLSLISNRVKYIEMGLNAQQRLDIHFSSQETIRQHLAYFNHLIKD